MPGYAIPIAKSQGMSIGANKPATHARVKLQDNKVMETLNLGLTYTALSRCERESNWCLVEKISEDRLMYINSHPHMKARKDEEERLKTLSFNTISKYSEFYSEDVRSYIELLQQLDDFCNDGKHDSICTVGADCHCILCSIRGK